jgi:hypothetical protein
MFPLTKCWWAQRWWAGAWRLQAWAGGCGSGACQMMAAEEEADATSQVRIRSTPSTVVGVSIPVAASWTRCRTCATAAQSCPLSSGATSWGARPYSFSRRRGSQYVDSGGDHLFDTAGGGTLWRFLHPEEAP